MVIELSESFDPSASSDFFTSSANKSDIVSLYQPSGALDRILIWRGPISQLDEARRVAKASVWSIEL